ncbi:MAG: hypothetical protein JXR96_08350 [Deltaproteobacteria bacterium]|nr:hypothetical protein [Deltaproteobacteria bacterium]
MAVIRRGSSPWPLGGILLCALAIACSGREGGDEPSCPQAYAYDWQALLPGPAEEGHDADLARLARMRDRQFWAFHALPTGLSAECSISRDKTAERAAVEDWLANDDGWDFAAYSGMQVADVVDSWWKVAGAYAGAGIAADAFRYGVMRDQCYPVDELDRAREQLLASAEGLHRAVAITGVEGVIVRGYAHKGYPGAGGELCTPLFDAQGMPLPEEKDNGTWREDNSGLYPDFIWEDSCSRDMLIGWALGFGALWEVVEDDPSIPAEVKQTLRDDARALARAYAVVRESGYDLEVPDADGRTTYHGYLNEQNVDRMYLPGARNGFHTIMALGILAALADVADDPQTDAYLYEELIGERDFVQIARDDMILVNMGTASNFSNYNMVVQGAWLALRHLHDDEAARAGVQAALDVQIYDSPGERFQPVEIGQSLFDFAYAAGMCGASARKPCQRAPDMEAVARGLQTLREFPLPPFWEFERVNCDPQELDAGVCTTDDGVQLDVLGEVGRNGSLVVAQPIPMRSRPPSNYYWRSNPYEPNGGADGPAMFPGVDFRLAYWLGRWVRVE